MRGTCALAMGLLVWMGCQPKPATLGYEPDVAVKASFDEAGGSVRPTPLSDAALGSADAAADAEVLAPCSPGLPKVVAELGCAVNDGDGSTGPAPRPVGFSKDGLLGTCVSTCDPCPLDCFFRGKDGAAQSFADFYAPSNPRVRALELSRLPEKERERRIAALEAGERAAFEKKVAALELVKGPPGRPLSGPFPYEDLRLVYRASIDATAGSATLLFGARVDGEEPSFPMRLTFHPHPMRTLTPKLDPKTAASLDAKGRAAAVEALRAEYRDQFTISEPTLAYADVTRDGSELGIVGVATGTMWWEEAESARMTTTVFVARVYSEAADRALKRGDTARGAALQAKAVAVSTPPRR